MAILLFFVGFIMLIKYIGSTEKESVDTPVLISSYGDAVVKRTDQGMLVTTQKGKVEVALPKVYFQVGPNSEMLVGENCSELRKGYVEFSGEGKVKVPNGVLVFSGRGFLSPEGVFILKGQGEIGGVKLQKGGAYYQGNEIRLSHSPLKVSALESVLEIKSPLPSIVEISRDSLFSRPEISQLVSSRRRFPLDRGIYYVRACWNSPFFHCTDFEKVKIKNLRAELRKIDKTPPSLEVTITPKGRVVIISGKTEVGVNLFINGSPIRIESDGSFYSTLEYDSTGIKKVTVEAVDSAGNRTVKEKEVVIYGD